jgi:N-acetylneuraminic acid mutarotase
MPDDYRRWYGWTGLVLSAAGLAVAACGSDRTPTAPEATETRSPAVSLATTSNTWSRRAALPGGPCEITAGLVVDATGRSTVYAFGGTPCQDEGDEGLVVAYDVTADTWTQKAFQSHPLAAMNGIGKIGSKLYMAGGWSFGSGSLMGSFRTWAYEPVGNRFIQKADMPKATAAGITGVIKDKLYVLPGYCEGANFPDPRYCDTEVIQQLFRYDPATNTWSTLPAAPHAHWFGAGGVINNKLYAAGGMGEGRLPGADLDVYDPVTNKWTTLAPLPAKASFLAGAVVRNRLYASGGAGSLVVYDPATNLWKQKRGPTYSHPAASRVMIDGKAYLLLVGGSHGAAFDIPNPSELYTP